MEKKLLIDGYVEVTKSKLNKPNYLKTNEEWLPSEFQSYSIDMEVKINLTTSGDFSCLLDDKGRPCKIKINNYILEKLQKGI